jgi:hypothetical protein
VASFSGPVPFGGTSTVTERHGGSPLDRSQPSDRRTDVLIVMLYKTKRLNVLGDRSIRFRGN